MHACIHDCVHFLTYKTQNYSQYLCHTYNYTCMNQIAMYCSLLMTPCNLGKNYGTYTQVSGRCIITTVAKKRGRHYTRHLHAMANSAINIIGVPVYLLGLHMKNVMSCLALMLVIIQIVTKGNTDCYTVNVIFDHAAICIQLIYNLLR